MPTDDRGETRLPPYIAFKTLTTFVSDLKDHGVPNRIDRSVLTRFSGGVGTQLMSALRYLALIDADGHPTEELRKLVDAYGTEKWQPELKGLIERHYRFVVHLGLSHITPHQLSDSFRTFGGKDEVLRKCQSFFLQAAQAAGMDVNARVLKRTRQRNVVGRKRASAQSAEAPAEKPRSNVPAEEPRVVYVAPKPHEVLFSILNMDRMSEEERAAVWTLLQYLKREELEQEVE